jgi:threonine synthase
MLSFCTKTVKSVAVKDSTFDDCQAIVKSIFADKSFCQKHNLLAVNSINIARVLAQIVYYIYAYLKLWKNIPTVKDGIKNVVFCVPTGNFGDILAGYYAQRMGFGGLMELVIGSNTNDILPRFFETGCYDCSPETAPFGGAVQATMSPSMDIQVRMISGY